MPICTEDSHQYDRILSFSYAEVSLDLTRHFLHELLILHGHLCQFLANFLMYIQILCHTPVDADHFTFACKQVEECLLFPSNSVTNRKLTKFGFAVTRRNALLVTGGCHAVI